MRSETRLVLGLKCGALLVSAWMLAGCEKSTLMSVSAVGYRQMGGPFGAGMALLMNAAAKDQALKEQRAHELAVAWAGATQNVLIVNGRYQPAPGYEWVTQTQGDLRVYWCPGKCHPENPNVLAGPVVGRWQPRAGFRWVTEAQDDIRVLWCPGVQHPTYPNIVAGDRENSWNPAPGYAWASSAGDDVRVVPKVAGDDARGVPKVNAPKLVAKLEKAKRDGLYMALHIDSDNDGYASEADEYREVSTYKDGDQVYLIAKVPARCKARIEVRDVEIKDTRVMNGPFEQKPSDSESFWFGGFPVAVIINAYNQRPTGTKKYELSLVADPIGGKSYILTTREFFIDFAAK